MQYLLIVCIQSYSFENLEVFKIIVSIKLMLGGSLVTMAWHVLRLQMEETASRYGG
jgi:hypothetical protein